MKKKFIFLFFLFFLDCATYWKHRKKDLQDIVTFGVEKKGYGTGGRLGPLALGFFFQGEEDNLSNQNKENGIGLRGGNFGRYQTKQLVFGFLGGENFYILKKKNNLENQRNEKKSHSVRYFDFYQQITPNKKLEERKQKYAEKMMKEIAKRHNQELPLSVFQKKKKTYPISYFFQMEVFFGLSYVLRFGFNFSELIDFVLGFTNLDILKDDIKK